METLLSKYKLPVIKRDMELRQTFDVITKNSQEIVRLQCLSEELIKEHNDKHNA